MKHSGRLWTVLAAVAAAFGGSVAMAQPQPACDRACLNGFVDRYLAALAAHDPARLAVTPTLRFTEDGAPLKLGDGLWRTNQGLGSYRLDFADPASGQAGALVTVKENGNLALMSLRLKVNGGRIGEVETVLARKGELQSLQTDLLQEPLPILLEDVPPARRSSRAELERIGNSYFDAIEKADGSIVPFADDGFRIENGVRTCNNPAPTTGGASPDFARLRGMKCADQLSTKIFTYIQSVRPRRFVVDEKKGLILAEVRFNHPGDVPYADTPGYGRVSMAQNPWAVRPTSALISELFKIEDHKIQRVMAVITNVPYRMPTGWETPAAR
jgi:hypothetical protein